MKTTYKKVDERNYIIEKGVHSYHATIGNDAIIRYDFPYKVPKFVKNEIMKDAKKWFRSLNK